MKTSTKNPADRMRRDQTSRRNFTTSSISKTPGSQGPSCANKIRMHTRDQASHHGVTTPRASKRPKKTPAARKKQSPSSPTYSIPQQFRVVYPQQRVCRSKGVSLFETHVRTACTSDFRPIQWPRVAPLSCRAHRILRRSTLLALQKRSHTKTK